MRGHRNVALALIAGIAAVSLLTAQQAQQKYEPMEALAKKLGLSAKQKERIHAIRADFDKKRDPLDQQLWKLHQQEREAMRNVLTPAQRDQVPKALAKEKDRELRAVAAKLGVTAEQKQRIDKVRDDYKMKFRALAADNKADVSQQFLQLRHQLFQAMQHELRAEQQAKLPEILREEFDQWRNPEARKQRQKALADQLGLSAEQRKQLDQIHDQYRPKIDQVAEQLRKLWDSERDQVENVLTAEQRQKLEKMQEGSARQDTAQPAPRH